VTADETLRPALARAATGVAAQSDWTQAGDDSCRTCGACCSYSADWPRFSLESDDRLARIPPALIAEDESGMRCIGTRCAALVGVVGRATSCGIYPSRPDVCVACTPGDAACLQARRHFGL
jgi:hypothetical protein